MQYKKQLSYWKIIMVLTIILLVSLSVFSYYGLYTDKFYLLKIDNYIFPLLTLVHFLYLYVVWFKIKEREIADPQMRNLEYSLYVIILVYCFKTIETLMTLMSYGDYDNHVIPSTFIPIGTTIFILYMFLLCLTFVSFKLRKEFVGGYDFKNMTDIDTWH